MKTKTILLVQDDEDSLSIYHTMLENTGYRVLSAERGEEAVRIAIEQRPKLIFTEARLPVVDGWRLLEVIRGEPALRELKLVLLTAWVEKGQRRRALAAGFDGFVPKPAEPARVLEEVLRLIGPPVPSPRVGE